MITVTPSPVTLSVTLPSGHKETLTAPQVAELTKMLIEAQVQVGFPAAGKAGKVVAAVCAEFQVSPADLASEGKPPVIAVPRMLAMSLLQEMCGFSSYRAGKMFGRDDHGTAIYAKQATANREETDPVFASRVKKIRAIIRNGADI